MGDEPNSYMNYGLQTTPATPDYSSMMRYQNPTPQQYPSGADFLKGTGAQLPSLDTTTGGIFGSDNNASSGMNNFGSTTQQQPPKVDFLNTGFGKGMMGLQTLGNLATAWSGLKGLELGRKQYRFQKGTTNRNVTEQAKSVNARLTDRYNARIGANPNAAKDLGTLDEYMGKFGANEKAIG